MRDRQEGFTLVELLVTVVVIGILAAIALPSLLSKTQNASDATAKALAHDGALAMETFAVAHDGYAATRQDVVALAPDLQSARWALDATATGFALTVTASSAHTFTVQRTLGGAPRHTCTAPGAGGCGDDGSW